MSKTFLSDIIAAAGGDMKNAGRKTIEYIALDKIFEDERNFYHIDDQSVEELAANIATVGLQQPILVRDEMNGEYTIVSGHRRYAALCKLQENDPEKWWEVPCIVERAGVSQAMQELQLIFANSATRKLSDSDIAKQTERVTELLYQLREEGVEFPGSMRKHVAEACKISETKLATLKVISEHLHEHFKEKFSTGHLPTNTAYNIARLPALVQEDLAKAMPQRLPSGVAADNLLKHYEKYYDLSRMCPDGTQICDNAKGMLSKTAHSMYSWDFCTGKCCMSCSDSMSCSYACGKAKEKKKNAKADSDREKEMEEQRRQEKFQQYKRETIESAKRLLALADAAGVSDKESAGVGYAYSGITFGTLRTWVKEDGGDRTFYDNNATFRDVENMVKTAKLLGVSTDVLLGLAEPGEKTAAPAAPEWKTGKPETEGLYIGRFFTDGMGKPMLQPAIWRDGCWNFHNISASIDMECVGWHKIPEV